MFLPNYLLLRQLLLPSSCQAFLHDFLLRIRVLLDQAPFMLDGFGFSEMHFYISNRKLIYRVTVQVVTNLCFSVRGMF